MEDELTALQARICKALSHPKRLEIIYKLREGERSVGELAKELQLSYANLSQHLRGLLQSDLVEVRHEGQHSYYRLAAPQIAEACDLVRKALRERLKQLGELAHISSQEASPRKRR